MNASCPCEANTRCTAFPDADSRSVNRKQWVRTPSSSTHRSAKSTSASAPGACACGTNACSTERPASAAIPTRRRAT